jgi:5'-3' exonuclease
MFLIIDTSYAVFYRFYAIKSYLKISKNKMEIELSMKDVKFKDMFKKTFKKMIYDLTRKFKPDKIIFALDCENSKIWRNNLMEGYKGNRKNNDFDGTVFPFTIQEILPELQSEMLNFTIRKKLHRTDVYIMFEEKAEADDMVYIYCKRTDAKEKKKIIITSDNDYLQLLDTNTEIFDLKGTDLRTKSLGDSGKDILIKVLGGDPSDNIPKLLTKMKTLEMIKNLKYKEICNLFENDSNGTTRERFRLNMNLVNMSKIPESIVKKALLKLTF